MSDILRPHWVVGDRRIFNQFEAALTAFRSGGPAYRFVFLEHIYDAVDWTQEPAESWEELCLSRALYLRNKWRKLKLCFSAGRDSGHIMQLFERHGLRIDELILPYSIHHPLRMSEHVNIVLPAAQAACRRNPGMTIREICIDHKEFDRMFGNPDWLTGQHSNQRSMQFTAYDWKRIIETDPDHSSGQAGYIFGLEKPRIRLIDGNFYFQSMDYDYQYFWQDITNAEWFYWAPEQPELCVKQAWMLVNHFERYYPGCDPEFVSSFQNYKSGHYDEFCRSVGRGDPITAGVDLAQGKISDNYHWALTATIDTARNQRWKGYKEWASIIDDLRRNHAHCFNQTDPMKGPVGIWGKPYFIKKQKILES